MQWSTHPNFCVYPGWHCPDLGFIPRKEKPLLPRGCYTFAATLPILLKLFHDIDYEVENIWKIFCRPFAFLCQHDDRISFGITKDLHAFQQISDLKIFPECFCGPLKTLLRATCGARACSWTTLVYNICKSEWTSSTLPISFQQYPSLNDTLSITQIRLKLLEFTQMFVIVFKFQWSHCNTLPKLEWICLNLPKIE